MLATEVASTGSLSPTGGTVTQEFCAWPAKQFTKALGSGVRQKQLFLGTWLRAKAGAWAQALGAVAVQQALGVLVAASVFFLDFDAP